MQVVIACKKPESPFNRLANPIDQLQTMFLSDIENGYQFRFLFKYRDTLQGFGEESTDYREMMQIFRDLLNDLQSSQLINSSYTIGWIENFYLSTIDAAINLILEDKTNEKEIKQMAWLSFLNGVSAKLEN